MRMCKNNLKHQSTFFQTINKAIQGEQQPANNMQNSPGARSHHTRVHGGDVHIVASRHTQRRTGELVGAARYLWNWRECRRLQKQKGNSKRVQSRHKRLSECTCIKIVKLNSLCGKTSHPGRRILQDVGFQLLHEHLVVKDNDGVIVALSDQYMLKGLQQWDTKRCKVRNFIMITSYYYDHISKKKKTTTKKTKSQLLTSKGVTSWLVLGMFL